MRLECPFPHVLALQCVAGGGLAGQLAVLDFRKAAPWQVPRRPGRAAGQGSAATANALHACNLGARGLSRRGVGGQRVGTAVAPALPGISGGGLDHYRHRPEAGNKTFWRRQRLLLSAGFCLCHSTVYVSFAATTDSPSGDRVLAQLSAPGARQRRPSCRGECAYFRSLASWISSLPFHSAASSSKH